MFKGLPNYSPSSSGRSWLPAWIISWLTFLVPMDSCLSTGFSQGRVRGSTAQLPPYHTASQRPLGTSPIPALPGKEQRVVMILPLQYRFCMQPSCLVKISQALLLGIWARGHSSATDVAMVARATQMRAGLGTFLQVPIFRDWDVAYCVSCVISL